MLGNRILTLKTTYNYSKRGYILYKMFASRNRYIKLFELNIMNVFIPLYRTFKNDRYTLCTITEYNVIYVQKIIILLS